jgi:hypothetical protein
MTVDLQRLSLRAHLCPFELLPGRVLSLRPCGWLEGGFVYVNKENAPAGTDPIDRYSLLRASPFVRLTLAPAGGAQLRLDAGLELLALRHEVYIDDTSVVPSKRERVYSPPPAGAYLAIAVAVEY